MEKSGSFIVQMLTCCIVFRFQGSGHFI